MKRWTYPLVLGALGLVALVGAFGVSRATASSSMHHASTSALGAGSGCDRLMSNPVAMEAMQPLHAEHVQDMESWQDRYGTDTGSAEARSALKTMRGEHMREMRAAFQKLGIKTPAGFCTASMMGGASGTGMMGGSAASSDVHQQHHGGNSGSTGEASQMMGSATRSMMGGTL